MRTIDLSVVLLLGAIAVSAACSPKPQSPPTPSPTAVLEAIPAVDPARYQLNRDAKNWQNPYLVVRPDGIGLVDLKNSEIVILKPEQVPDALAKLPPSAWPYGRVVAVAENAKNDSEQDHALMRKNRAVLAGTLQSLQVLIHWIPS